MLKKKEADRVKLESEIMSFWPSVPKIEYVPEPEICLAEQKVETSPANVRAIQVVEEGDSNISPETSLQTTNSPNMVTGTTQLVNQAQVIIETPAPTIPVSKEQVNAQEANHQFSANEIMKQPAPANKPWLNAATTVSKPWLTAVKATTPAPATVTVNKPWLTTPAVQP
jgi:hypothetical protein